MNLESELTLSEFEHLWSEIIYEFNKITSIKSKSTNTNNQIISQTNNNTYNEYGDKDHAQVHSINNETDNIQRCNGIFTYNNIYKIITAKKYTNNLYWKIGEYLYNLAKDRRSKIPYENDNRTSHLANFNRYLEEYSKYFLQYQEILISINSLCLVLNDNLGTDKPVLQLGYLLWERCILQEIEKTNNRSLPKELIHMMFNDMENEYEIFIDHIKKITAKKQKIFSFKKPIKPDKNKFDAIQPALTSLKNVVLDDDPLSYYKVSYEDKSLKKYFGFLNEVKEQFFKKKRLKNGPLSPRIYTQINTKIGIIDYINIVDHIYTLEFERRNTYFLSNSHKPHNKILEQVFIDSEKKYIVDGIYNILLNYKENNKPNDIHLPDNKKLNENIKKHAKDTFKAHIKNIYKKLQRMTDNNKELFAEALNQYTSFICNEMKEKNKNSNHTDMILNIHESLYSVLELVNTLENRELLILVCKIYMEHYKDDNLEELLAEFSMYKNKEHTDILGYKEYNHIDIKSNDNNNTHAKECNNNEINTKKNNDKETNSKIYNDNNTDNNCYTDNTNTPYNYNCIITVYNNLINIIKNEDLFLEHYIKYLMKRLLKYTFDDRKEKIIHELLKKYSINYYNKINRMYQDINRSISINSYINNIRNRNIDDINNRNHNNSDQGIYNTDNNVVYDINNSICFITILTECVWPIEKFEDRELSTNGNNDDILTRELLDYKELFIEEYLQKYKRRKIYIIWSYGYVDINITTDKEYCIRINIYQYILLEMVENNRIFIPGRNNIGITEIVDYFKNNCHLNISEEDINVLLKYKLLYYNDNSNEYNDSYNITTAVSSTNNIGVCLLLNYNFYHKNNRICMLPIIKKKVENIVSDPLVVLQAFISRMFKKIGNVGKDVCYDFIIKEIKECIEKEGEYKDFSGGLGKDVSDNKLNSYYDILNNLEDNYTDTMKELIDKGLIEEDKDKYYYVP
ncbi:Cullin-like protein [Spraguea lophii 42_110]|uniref:Cullin-like protein n=1 Tax=Spraguea lophii (strain 42_110) TaxID=1358809 RepID=S7WAC2_SPRLO|nr:Cullin-like protein [Spraguea lophii 42_110]